MVFLRVFFWLRADPRRDEARREGMNRSRLLGLAALFILAAAACKTSKSPVDRTDTLAGRTNAPPIVQSPAVADLDPTLSTSKRLALAKTPGMTHADKAVSDAQAVVRN